MCTLHGSSTLVLEYSQCRSAVRPDTLLATAPAVALPATVAAVVVASAATAMVHEAVPAAASAAVLQVARRATPVVATVT
jgi:hypothetical protein